MSHRDGLFEELLIQLLLQPFYFDSLCFQYKFRQSKAKNLKI